MGAVIELIDLTVYETTREVSTKNIHIPEGTLLQFQEGEPYESPTIFVVWDGPFKGAEFSYIRDVVVLAGLVEVVFY